MSTRSVTNLAFDGPALTGVMDVRELAPALLSVGSLLENANRVLNGETSKVHIYVKSDFKTGSFEVGLEVVQSLADTVKAILEISPTIDAVKLLEIVGLAAGGAISLIKLLKMLRARTVINITAIDTEYVRIYTEGDHDPIDVLETTARLFQDQRVRKDAEGMVKPLEQAGIDRLVIRAGDQDVESIEKDEREYFSAPDLTAELIDNTFTAVYEIVSASFDSEIKWRLFDGTHRIPASMKDEEFLALVDDGLTFAKGDAIKVKMRLRQWATSEGLKTEHEVVRVIQHFNTQRYIQLPLQPPPGETEEG
jgi:hypothetical protein